MKSIFYYILSLAFLLSVLSCASVQEHPSGRPVGFEVGHIAPNFSARDLDGNHYELWELTGKKVILSFWATYDANSRLQLDDLQTFYNSMDKDRVKLLGITYKEQEGDVIPLLTRRRINYPNIIDRHGRIGPLYGITIIDRVNDFGQQIIDPESARSFPVTLFINEDSTIERIISVRVNMNMLEQFAYN